MRLGLSWGLIQLTVDRSSGLSQNEQNGNMIASSMAGHVHEPHIPCPKCGHQIPLTESIAAPLLEAERRGFQTTLAAKEAEFARKADELRQQQDEVAKARANVEEQIKQRLETERRQVAAAEAKKARDAVASDLQARANEVAELQRTLESNNVKLAEGRAPNAQKAARFLNAVCKLHYGSPDVVVRGTTTPRRRTAQRKIGLN